MARLTRTLTAEEKRLWHYVTRNDRRLHAAPPPEPEEEIAPFSATQEPKALPPSLPPRSVQPPSLLFAGDYSAVDGALAQRMRRGKYKADQALDLHGMDRIAAQDALVGAINRAYGQRARMLLVITGKGRLQGGVLKSMLPIWLNLPDLRPLILAFDTARPEHGGEGAWYVLLKRRRES